MSLYTGNCLSRILVIEIINMVPTGIYSVGNLKKLIYFRGISKR